jgi:biotin carboxylase
VVAGHPREKSARLLVLGAGPAQLGLLEAASERGVWTAVADRDPAAPGFRLADRRCIVSTEDEPAIERLAAALDLDGIIAPGTDWPVAVAARVAEKLALPHPVTAATAVLATNKLRQREALDGAGVPQPRWQAVTDTAEIDLELPLVVKAPDRQGQKGLSLVRTREELPAAIAAARTASRNGVAIVEELVDGPEVTVIGFSTGGDFSALAVTDRLPSRRRSAWRSRTCIPRGSRMTMRVHWQPSRP